LTSSSDPSCHRRRKFLSSTSSPHRRCMARSLFEADSGSARLFHLTQLGSTIVDLAPSARLGLAHPSGSARLGCYRLGSVSSVVSASPVRLGIVPTLVSKKTKKRGLLCSCSVALLFVTRLYCFHTNKNITEGKKTLLAPLFLFAFAVVLLRSRRHHGFFFDFFRPCPSIAMSGAFQWHQLLACICTCVDFVFGSSLRVSCPARHLLRLLLSQ
jgi:hypothetical protein